MDHLFGTEPEYTLCERCGKLAEKRTSNARKIGNLWAGKWWVCNKCLDWLRAETIRTKTVYER